ncbi:MAG TPA: hypothetical protein VJ952_02660 [Opitutales bacterium]|nr:hypothetical protein [Opitutales bacterium]
MKNVTITVDEDVARWAKVWAAKHDTSVSKMLGGELREKMERERSYDRSMKRYFAKPARPLKSQKARYPKRESLYER